MIIFNYRKIQKKNRDNLQQRDVQVIAIIYFQLSTARVYHVSVT